MSPSPVVICPIWPLSLPTLLPYLRPYSPVATPSMASSAPAPNLFCLVGLGVASKIKLVPEDPQAPFNLQQVGPLPPYTPVFHLFPNLSSYSAHV
jgi:hypothetical protein